MIVDEVYIFLKLYACRPQFCHTPCIDIKIFDINDSAMILVKAG